MPAQANGVNAMGMQGGGKQLFPSPSRGNVHPMQQQHMQQQQQQPGNLVGKPMF